MAALDRVEASVRDLKRRLRERFEKKLGDNLYKLWNRMSSGSYVPPPVKAVPIPKKSGGVRILGIPTVADRIAQTTVKMWLEPRLAALEAIAVTRRRRWDYDWVVEFDIRGLFNATKARHKGVSCRRSWPICFCTMRYHAAEMR